MGAEFPRVPETVDGSSTCVDITWPTSVAFRRRLFIPNRVYSASDLVAAAVTSKFKTLPEKKRKIGDIG